MTPVFALQGLRRVIPGRIPQPRNSLVPLRIRCWVSTTHDSSIPNAAQETFYSTLAFITRLVRVLLDVTAALIQPTTAHVTIVITEVLVCMKGSVYQQGAPSLAFRHRGDSTY